MLGQLSGQQEPDGGLDLPGGDGGPLVVVGELAGPEITKANLSFLFNI